MKLEKDLLKAEEIISKGIEEIKKMLMSNNGEYNFLMSDIFLHPVELEKEYGIHRNRIIEEIYISKTYQNLSLIAERYNMIIEPEIMYLDRGKPEYALNLRFSVLSRNSIVLDYLKEMEIQDNLWSDHAEDPNKMNELQRYLLNQAEGLGLDIEYVFNVGENSEVELYCNSSYIGTYQDCGLLKEALEIELENI